MAKKSSSKRSAAKPATKTFRKAPAKRPRGEDALPSREQILTFLRDADAKAGKREIARAFNIKGDARSALKRLLAEMTDEGLLTGTRKDLSEPGKLPPVTVLEVTGRDSDGDLIAHPAVWKASDGEAPVVLVLSNRPRSAERDAAAAIGIGDRILARITRLDRPNVDGHAYEATPIRVLPRERRRQLGIFRTRRGGGGSIEPIDRRELRAWTVRAGNEGSARDGDLVRFDLSAKNRQSISEARVLESLGNPDDQRKISLIAVHAHGIPDDFPEPVIAESEALTPFTGDGRTDLRDTPLLTIDPIDARDHDDAVYAEADTDPKNRGGYVVLVAIADVAHYVRPGTRLDKEARLRGNSVYFPDRVVPMLPERISNDLCSLREHQDRPCLAVRMVFDAGGNKRRHQFLRAVMKSAAKLSYQEAQAAIDGNVSEKCVPLMKRALLPLWQAYEALVRARDIRGPLDLDLPERKIRLDDQGRVAEVLTPERLDAHRLIEELMIQANVAAAETLEASKMPLLYRTHDEPSKEKLKNLRDFLETLDLKLASGTGLRPEAFNRILARAKTLPVPELVNEVILRSQAQAEYTPGNIGHFGLNLAKYAHFTSPIRRYADLVVHRALIRALELGEGGLSDEEKARLGETAAEISAAERRAMAAERETIDRLIAAHLADRVGATFEGRIAGVTRSGLFVKLRETGADGFIPVSTLGQEYFTHVEEAHALVGNRSGETYQLGDPATVRLVEAIPTAGALRFEMLSPGKKGAPNRMARTRTFRRRDPRRR